MECLGWLINGFDPCDFGDMLAKVTLDAQLERLVAGGAADAGPEQSDLDDALTGDIDEFDIPAVRLDGRTDEIDDPRDAFAQRARAHVGRS